jgi:hypothetical protein
MPRVAVSKSLATIFLILKTVALNIILSLGDRVLTGIFYRIRCKGDVMIMFKSR